MLPVELILLIFELAAESFHPVDLSPTLRSCCLVSKAWRYLAQPILFATLPQYKKGHNGEALLQTLTSEERFQRHIRHLWVTPEMFKYQGLLFKLLSQVRGLGLRQSGYSELAHYPRAFHSILTSASLTTLSLQALEDFPVQLFYNCAALQELHISNSTFELSSPVIHEGVSGQDGAVVLRPHLRYLHLDLYQEEETPIMSWLQQPDSAFDLSQLHTFHISSHSSRNKLQFQAISDFINHIASSVEDLMVNVPRTFVPGVAQHDASYKAMSANLSKLRVVRFRFMDTPNRRSTLATLSTISWIMDFLSNIPRPNLLEEIWVPALLPHRTVNEASVAIRKLYGSLDKILTGAAFASLRRVWLVYWEPSLSIPARGDTRMKELLPWLSGKGIISMRYPKYGRHVVTEVEDSLYGLLMRPLNQT
ncbi:hypothetical protein BDN72DRAFT_958011 [Pluteus cervinus]|uniref:Uncharacterized protein n=1 Tax=Pluteus cervinus TaxID=181527 RepID=A0ACD3B0P2_9AGAR|nr:hypothetical protein BDN72DRAFT_958011 [Pluteus cervinus]